MIVDPVARPLVLAGLLTLALAAWPARSGGSFPDTQLAFRPGGYLMIEQRFAAGRVRVLDEAGRMTATIEDIPQQARVLNAGVAWLAGGHTYFAPFDGHRLGAPVRFGKDAFVMCEGVASTPAGFFAFAWVESGMPLRVVTGGTQLVEITGPRAGMHCRVTTTGERAAIGWADGHDFRIVRCDAKGCTKPTVAKKLLPSLLVTGFGCNTDGCLVASGSEQHQLELFAVGWNGKRRWSRAIDGALYGSVALAGIGAKEMAVAYNTSMNDLVVDRVDVDGRRTNLWRGKGYNPDLAWADDRLIVSFRDSDRGQTGTHVMRVAK